MDRDCTAIGELLVEAAGDTSALTSSQREHLDECPACRALANAERKLDQLLETAVPPEDLALQERVMRNLEPQSRWSRTVAFLPVAVSLLVAFTGVTMIGGLPGSSLLSRFPVWSSQGWMALVGATSDWLVALATTSKAAHLALPSTVQIGAAALAILGLSSVVVVTRRWRAFSPWRSKG